MTEILRDPDLLRAVRLSDTVPPGEKGLIGRLHNPIVQWGGMLGSAAIAGGTIAGLWLLPDQAAIVVNTSVVLLLVWLMVILTATLIMAGRTRRAVNLLYQAIDSGDAGVIVATEAGRILYANDRMHEMFGRDAQLSWDAIRAQLNGDRDPAVDMLFESAAHGTAREAELDVGAAGAERTMLVSERPIPKSGGHVRWRFKDVTADRQIDALVDAERTKLIDLMDNASVGILAVDAEGHFEFVNATFADWVGMNATDLSANEWALHDFLLRPASDLAPHAALRGERSRHAGQVQFVAVDGREFLAAVDQTLVRDASGHLIRARYIIRDLEPELRWQDALRISEQRFRRVFQEAPIGILLLGGDGRIRESNDAAETVLGLAAAELIDHPLADFVDANDHEGLQADIAQAATDPTRPATRTVRLNGRAAGQAQFFFRRIDTAEEGEAADATLIVHVIDVSEQKRLEEQFAQSQKMQAVGQLAGGVAHDFNNLLTAMIGFCDLLLQRHRPGDPSFADIMQVKQNANRAANLVRQLLAFSRQQTLRPQVLDVTDVLAELAHLLRRLIGENIELDLVHGRDLGLVKVDQGQLEQVIINLVVNARDAMRSGGNLAVRTANHALSRPQRLGDEEMPAGEWVRIDVIDNGTGIDPAVLPRIFEPFFSTKAVGSGTGLGLSTVYGIVRQTGGFITVESRVGEGTTFTIFLPRHYPAPEALSAPGTDGGTTASDLTGAGRIVLAEDEEAVRAFSARALRNKGYDVLEAPNGEQAIVLFEESELPIQLLITDVVMPGIDGPTLIARIRERWPETRVLCISGYAEERMQDSLSGLPDVHFLAKPYSLKDLAATVKEALATP